MLFRSVVFFALSLQMGNMIAGNFILRLLALWNFQRVLSFISRMESLHAHTHVRQWIWSLQWSKNEVAYVVLLLANQSFRLYGLSREMADYLRTYPWSFLYGGPIRDAKGERPAALITIDTIIFWYASFLAGPMVNDFLALLLLSLVTFVARNVKVEPRTGSIQTLALRSGLSKTRPTIFSNEIAGEWEIGRASCRERV